MDGLFTIGEVSKLFHIDVRLLRHYDKISLLKPECNDKNTGYRYYSTRQFECLNTIRYLRSLNIPLAKIREFLENRDDKKMLEILSEQGDLVRKERENLDRIERKIQSRILQIKDVSQTQYGIIEERKFEERKIAALKKEISVSEDLEHPIRELELVNGLNSIMFLGKVGVSIARENLLKSDFESFSSIFVLIEPDDECGECSSIIEEGDYLIERFHGIHKDSQPVYRHLFDYMKEKDYELAGDSLEFALIDSGITFDSTKFTTEIQIPYKKC